MAAPWSSAAPPGFFAPRRRAVAGHTSSRPAPRRRQRTVAELRFRFISTVKVTVCPPPTSSMPVDADP
jgi:hypothetical protein